MNTNPSAAADRCYICLSAFETQALGSLQSCLHVFCLDCILQWSQTANTCPVDRTSFAFVHQRACPGGEVQNKIKVRVQKKDEDDEEVGNSAVICEECGRSDRSHRLLLCDLCDSGYHMDCLRPSLTSGPEGAWICPDCVLSPHSTESFRAEEEISDGELTDLLAEVDQLTSTSSRLRASTLNRPSSFTEARRSSRIQSRGGRRPHPVPPTCWHVPKYLLRASRPAAATEDSANQADPSSTSSRAKTRKRKKRAA